MAAQPPQPPIVTLTCLLAIKNEPSFILATAITSCVAARRMRVLASATPLAGEKWNVTTPERGFSLATIMTSVTWDCAVIGLSTVTVIGTVLPFSAISANPYIQFKFRAEQSGQVVLSWTDDDGSTIVGQDSIKVI